MGRSRLAVNRRFLESLSCKGPFERHGLVFAPELLPAWHLGDGSFALPEPIDLSQSFGGLGMPCCAWAEHPFAPFCKISGFYGFNRVQARQGWDTILALLGGADGPVHVIAWIDERDMERLIRTAPPVT